MNVEGSYDLWAAQYDSGSNKTRDAEAASLRLALTGMKFKNCLEIGCGTAKNTEWLSGLASHVTSVDISAEMLKIAKKKITAENVTFQKLDVRENWPFDYKYFDLVVCSLVLEHLSDLDKLFKSIAESLQACGIFYIGELHPFKQYLGSKANFSTPNGRHEVACFIHHLSEFTSVACSHGMSILEVTEHFDKNDNSRLPRILALTFKKQ